MNERRRQQYLEAMGIESFVPRLQLVGAKASEPCAIAQAAPAVMPMDGQYAANLPGANAAKAMDGQYAANLPGANAAKAMDGQYAANLPGANAHASVLGSEVVTPSLTGETVSSAQETPRAPLIAREALQAENQDASPALAEPSPASDAQSKTESVEAARFTLSVWRVSETLLAVDSCDTSSVLPTAAVLQSICHCCGISSRLGNEERLYWPMVELPDKPIGWEDARLMIANYLEGKLLARPVATILLFGEQSFRACADVLLDSQAYSDACYSIISIDAFAAEALVLPSLSSILRSPDLKKPVWHALCENGLVSS